MSGFTGAGYPKAVPVALAVVLSLINLHDRKLDPRAADGPEVSCWWSEEVYRIFGLDPAGPSPSYEDMLRLNRWSFYPMHLRYPKNPVEAAARLVRVYERAERLDDLRVLGLKLLLDA